jgi:hypothetical protein
LPAWTETSLIWRSWPRAIRQVLVGAVLASPTSVAWRNETSITGTLLAPPVEPLPAFVHPQVSTAHSRTEMFTAVVPHRESRQSDRHGNQYQHECGDDDSYADWAGCPPAETIAARRRRRAE